jgi:hypothetical protein
LSGAVRWEGRQFGDQWWTGIEGTYEGVLLLHGYMHPDMPGHRGITAVDIETGEPLWANAGVAFAGAGDGVVLGARNGTTGTELVELNLRTGAIRRVLGEGRVPPVKNTPTDRTPGFGVALRWIEDERIKEIVSGFPEIEKESAEAFVLPAFVVVSGIAPSKRKEKGGGEQILAVIDRESGGVVYRETLQPDVLATVPESFIVLQDTLYFVRHRTILTAVSLAQR